MSKRPPVERTPMTDHDIDTIMAFKRVSFSMPSQRRFAKDLLALLLNNPGIGLSDRQREYMYQIAYKHRRQIPRHLVLICCTARNMSADWFAKPLVLRTS